MAQHYEVKPGEALVINGPANIIVKAGALPLVGTPGPAPTLSDLEPDTAVVGDPDLVMTVTGSDFTEGSVIVFNGGDEPTTFVSAGELSTTIKPSLVGAPIAVPVLVRSGVQSSEPLDFTFTDVASGTRKKR